jgi:hypothetical protein
LPSNTYSRGGRWGVIGEAGKISNAAATVMRIPAMSNVAGNARVVLIQPPAAVVRADARFRPSYCFF